MTKPLTSFPTVPFIGQPLAQPLGLYKPDNQQAALEVPIFVDWKLYNNNGAIPNIGINLNLNQGVAGQANLQTIRSVFIDNTGSNIPVYVLFPDTGFVVPCGPASQTLQTIMSNSTTPIIFGTGFTGGPQPQTLVIFANKIMQPANTPDTAFVQPQYLASVFAGNPVLNQTPYRALALGDQLKVINLNAAVTSGIVSSTIGTLNLDQITGASASTTFQFPLTGVGQYIYITDIQLSGYALGEITSASPPGTIFVPLISLSSSDGSLNYETVIEYDNLEPTNALGTIIKFQGNILNLSGLQLKLAASNTFTLKSAPALMLNGTTTGNHAIAMQGIANLTCVINYTMRDESISPI